MRIPCTSVVVVVVVAAAAAAAVVVVVVAVIAAVVVVVVVVAAASHPNKTSKDNTQRYSELIQHTVYCACVIQAVLETTLTIAALTSGGSVSSKES